MKEQDKRFMIIWPDGEYLYDEQFDLEPNDGLGYPKSDDYEKRYLDMGFNYIDLNGLILTVELDYWGNVWERELFNNEPPYEPHDYTYDDKEI